MNFKSNIFKSAIILVVSMLVSGSSLAQNITETNWYFGSGNTAFEIDKSGRDASVLHDQAVPFGAAGSSVINDRFTGNLLFYTDGQRVYDATHRLIPALAGGALLFGNPNFNQPVVSVPFPDGSDEYYIFTNDGIEITYSVMDASLAGNSTQPEFPLGDLTVLNEPTGLTTAAQGMVIVPSGDGQSFWLITQDTTTFDFRVTAIDNAGIGATTTFDVFPDGVSPFQMAQLAYKQDSAAQLAIAPKRANRNVLLLNFDSNAGTLEFNRQVVGSGFDDAGSTVIFDVEWSNDGTKLYVSRTGDDTNPGAVYQVDFSDSVNTNPPLNAIVDYSFFRSYGLKRGIDGRIYHLHQLEDATSPFLLGRIGRPDSTVDAGVAYDSLVFEDDFAGTQFPQFAPSYLPPDFFTLDFTYLDSCENSATKFIPIVDPLPHNYFWDFGDGTGARSPAPIHSYEAPGGYFVSLIVELNGTFQTISKPVDILAGDSAVDLGNDTTICVDEILELDAGDDGVAFLWSTGEQTQTIQVDTAGTYWVEVTGPSGCTSFDDIVVTEYGVQAQYSNQWYFGEMAGVDFSNGPPIGLDDDNMMFSEEGCATISDENGELLFYTNGSTVWNKDHQVMQNGDSIGGDSTSAQSAMILPFSGDNTMFYIFTTEEVYGDFSYQMKMTIVDMKYDTARGQVVSKNIPLINSSTERITASGFTGTPFIMAHEYGNNAFRAYNINNFGLSTAIYSSAGEDHRFQNELNATGYMKFSPDGQYVAVVLPGDSNLIELLNFDPATGGLSNSRRINIEEAAPAQIYGLEFTAGGEMLYVTTTGAGSKLIRFDLDSIDAENAADFIEATKVEVATGTGFGALQRGPDAAIYLTIDGTTSLPRIDNATTDSPTLNMTSAVDLLGRVARLGLPNFTQQLGASPQQPGIATDIACAGDTSRFSGAGRDSSIEEYYWDFGDGTGIFEGQDTSHVYQDPGTYIVQLRLSNRCDTDTILTDTIEVFTSPQLPTVPSDTFLCGNELVLTAWPQDDPDLSYEWTSLSPSWVTQTTRSITITADDFDGEVLSLDVQILDATGCNSQPIPVNIGLGSSIELGNDRTVCQNDSLVLEVNPPGQNFFTWFAEGVELGDQRTQLVNTSVAGTFTYTIEVLDDFRGCIYTDSVEVTILPGPEAVQSNVVPPECGEPNGSFQLDIATSGSYTYSISGPVAAGPFTFDGPGTTPPLTDLPSGSYTAQVTNGVTGCANTVVLQLEDNAPFDIAAEPIDDCLRTSDISVNFISNLPRSVEISVLDRQGTNVFTNTYELTTRNVRIDNLDTGRYYVEVRDLSPPGCIQTDTVQLGISENCYRRIFIPNAFSPNGNGENEEFFAFPNEFVDQFQIFIYNRWGDLVYYSQDKNFRWDGKYEGLIVAPGTYATKILFTSTLEPELGTIEQFGSVTVVR